MMKLKISSNKPHKVIFSSLLSFDSRAPEPAQKNIPSWYKEMVSYGDLGKKPNGQGRVDKTIKKCIPVLDAINSGYLFFTHGDIYVSQRDGAPYFEWTGEPIIEFHNVWQVEKHPFVKNKKMNVPKYLNPWVMKTPKGYSTLFVPPIHRDTPFKILEGVVDTDDYNTNVNFPFVLADSEFEGMIPAGTPIAQAIPFQRQEWSHEIGNNADIDKAHNIQMEMRQYFNNYYRNKFWVKKAYK